MTRLRYLSKLLITHKTNFSTSSVKTANQRLTSIARNINLTKTDCPHPLIENGQAQDRKLIILMSWLEAKEKHIEKYRDYYMKRGFDVLSVKTSAKDIVFPGIGPKEIGLNLIRFISSGEYPNAMIHGFSVGGFMLGQTLLVLDHQDEATKDKFFGCLRGAIFDSIISVENVSIGIANGVTRNKALAKFYELLMNLYLVLGHNVSTKHYNEGVEKIRAGLLRCPSLFLTSKGDLIADPKIAMNLAERWAAQGLSVRQVVFDDAPHVQIYKMYPERYIEEVQRFMKEIEME